MGGTKITDDMIRILCTIATRDDSGKHFTKKFSADDLMDLEDAGLIDVSRPIHEPSGIMFDRDQWTCEVTDGGLELVAAHPELHPV
jgi:hypothetical protein